MVASIRPSTASAINTNLESGFNRRHCTCPDGQTSFNQCEESSIKGEFKWRNGRSCTLGVPVARAACRTDAPPASATATTGGSARDTAARHVRLVIRSNDVAIKAMMDRINTWKPPSMNYYYWRSGGQASRTIPPVKIWQIQMASQPSIFAAVIISLTNRVITGNICYRLRSLTLRQTICL